MPSWLITGIVVIVLVLWIGNKLLDGAAFVYNKNSNRQAHKHLGRQIHFTIPDATSTDVIERVEASLRSLGSVSIERTPSGLLLKGGLAGSGISFSYSDGTSDSPMSFTSEFVAEQHDASVRGCYRLKDFHSELPPVEKMDALETAVKRAVHQSFPRAALEAS